MKNLIKIFIFIFLAQGSQAQDYQNFKIEGVEFFPSFVIFTQGQEVIEEPLEGFKIVLTAQAVWFFGRKVRILEATRSREKIRGGESFQTYICQDFNIKIFVVRVGKEISRVVVDYATTETRRIYTRKTMNI